MITITINWILTGFVAFLLLISLYPLILFTIQSEFQFTPCYHNSNHPHFTLIYYYFIIFSKFDSFLFGFSSTFSRVITYRCFFFSHNTYLPFQYILKILVSYLIWALILHKHATLFINCTLVDKKILLWFQKKRLLQVRSVTRKSTRWLNFPAVIGNHLPPCIEIFGWACLEDVLLLRHWYHIR